MSLSVRNLTAASYCLPRTVFLETLLLTVFFSFFSYHGLKKMSRLYFTDLLHTSQRHSRYYVFLWICVAKSWRLFYQLHTSPAVLNDENTTFVHNYALKGRTPPRQIIITFRQGRSTRSRPERDHGAWYEIVKLDDDGVKSRWRKTLVAPSLPRFRCRDPYSFRSFGFPPNINWMLPRSKQ